ncbi:MAG: ankyrin repeat domain-containing protein [Rhizobacter sp.]
MRSRHLLVKCVAGIIFALAVLYATFVGIRMRDDPLTLVVCIDHHEMRWMAWTCKQVLYHSSWSAEHVRRLNESAGASFAFGAEPPKTAPEADEIDMRLKLFLSRGVDINATDIRTRNWTALHSAAIGSHLHEAQLLLKYGARTDLRDTQGLTALDIALRIQEKYPDNPKAVEMVRLLQAHATSPQK